MENIIPIGSGVVAVMVVMLFILWRRMVQSAEKTNQEMKKLRHDLEIIQAQLNQAQFFNLDVSGIEKKVEEDIEQMDSFVHQEFASVSGYVSELNERLEALEEEDDNEDEEDDDSVETLEQRIEALEDRLDAIEDKSNDTKLA